MFYLISRYQVNSAEPETARYVFQTLALVCLMLVFYQQAAIRAGTGRFGSYHVWRSLALFLSLTAMPGSHNPMLYLAGELNPVLEVLYAVVIFLGMSHERCWQSLFLDI